MIDVDLRTRILPEDHQVFFARPGIQYRLFPEFIQEKAILLDLPFLDLSPGASFKEQNNIDAKIRRSRKLRSWYRSKGDEPEPSRDLVDYQNWAGDNGLSQIRGVLQGYLERARKGDIALVVPGGWNTNAYVGEFDKDGTDFSTHLAPRFYGEELLTGRSVNWIAKIQKRLLDADIIEIVQKPNVFVLLPRNVRKDIYSLAYPGYVIGDHYSARFDVSEESFRSLDDLIIQAFFNFIAANAEAIARDRHQDVRGITQGAFRDAGAFNMDLQTEVSSPGFLNLSALHITPLVVAALLALAVEVGPDAAHAVEAGQVRIGNSLAPAGDRCVVDVQEQAMRQIELLGLDRWGEACEKARRAANNTGIHGPARVGR